MERFPSRAPRPDLPAYVDRFFATLDAGKRFQIRLLLMLVEQATIFFPAPGRGGRRRFSRLDFEQRAAVLRDWSESRWFARRTVFTALRAVLTTGYLGHPVAMRALGLAPLAIESPVLAADCLYPPIGRPPEEIRHTADDRTPPSQGVPLALDGPLHPDFAAPGDGSAS